jgi:Na+-translocating ferredoxin:NAD+ oxidoreductase RNF subunit RnfB
MEKCKDSVRLLKVQLQELESKRTGCQFCVQMGVTVCIVMKEEEDLNAKVVFESSHVVTNLNGIGEDVWSWSKENSSFINRKV